MCMVTHLVQVPTDGHVMKKGQRQRTRDGNRPFIEIMQKNLNMNSFFFPSVKQNVSTPKNTVNMKSLKQS